MKPVRILICAAFYPPYRGGYAESVRALAEGMARGGHRVTIVANDTHGLAGNALDGAVRVVRIPSYNPPFLHGSFPLPHLFSASSAFRDIMRTGQDIVYTNTRFFPLTWIGFFFARIYRIPVVHIERGASHPVSHNRMIAVIGAIIDHTLGRLIFRFSDRVVGVSDAACRFARRLGAREPMRIHTGIDAGSWRRPADIIPDPFRIAYVGRLVHGKGVHDLFRAIAVLSREFPALSLSVAGDGPYRDFLIRLARDLGISDRISFLGDLDMAGIRDLLWRSSVLVNPSHSEGLPRAVLEAAAVGTAIIATDVGGTREIAGDGRGILVPPGDLSSLAGAMRRAICDPGLRKRMGNAAHAHVAALFSSVAMVGHYDRMHSLCAASRA